MPTTSINKGAIKIQNSIYFPCAQGGYFFLVDSRAVRYNKTSLVSMSANEVNGETLKKVIEISMPYEGAFEKQQRSKIIVRL